MVPEMVPWASTWRENTEHMIMGRIFMVTGINPILKLPVTGMV
jgi:hypothetical protein